MDKQVDVQLLPLLLCVNLPPFVDRPFSKMTSTLGKFFLTKPLCFRTSRPSLRVPLPLTWIGTKVGNNLRNVFRCCVVFGEEQLHVPLGVVLLRHCMRHNGCDLELGHSEVIARPVYPQVETLELLEPRLEVADAVLRLHTDIAKSTVESLQVLDTLGSLV